MMLDIDANAVVVRAAHQVALDATRNPLISPTFDPDTLRHALLHSAEPTWVLEHDGEIAAHLFGALLGTRHELAAWTGPDGYSYDAVGDLEELIEHASNYWRGRGAIEHFVWCLDRPDRLEDWLTMGYSRFSTRATLELTRLSPRIGQGEFLVRRGASMDLPAAYDLDEQLDEAQGDRPELRTSSERAAVQRQLRETLEDPENNHFVVESAGRVVAQCVTFAAPARRGSFPRTVFLSEVAVDKEFRRRGVARLLVGHALEHAREAGFKFCETQWRASNEEGSRFWNEYGFSATYARLGRML